MLRLPCFSTHCAHACLFVPTRRVKSYSASFLLPHRRIRSHANDSSTGSHPSRNDELLRLVHLLVIINLHVHAHLTLHSASPLIPPTRHGTSAPLLTGRRRGEIRRRTCRRRCRTRIARSSLRRHLLTIRPRPTRFRARSTRRRLRLRVPA